jgi:anion-transporting  ArsA/GET3 family ATPase
MSFINISYRLQYKEHCLLRRACHAFEIDTKDTIERSKNEIREKINWFLRFANLTTKADDFVKSATMNPAFEESAMFENMTDLRFKDEYDFYVFNTTPTANARRLLGMSNVYSLRVACRTNTGRSMEYLQGQRTYYNSAAGNKGQRRVYAQQNDQPPRYLT